MYKRWQEGAGKAARRLTGGANSVLSVIGRGPISFNWSAARLFGGKKQALTNGVTLLSSRGWFRLGPGLFSSLHACLFGVQIPQFGIIEISALAADKETNLEISTLEKLKGGVQARLRLPRLNWRQFSALDELGYEFVDVGKLRAVITRGKSRDSAIKRDKGDLLYRSEFFL